MSFNVPDTPLLNTNSIDMRKKLDINCIENHCLKRRQGNKHAIDQHNIYSSTTSFPEFESTKSMVALHNIIIVHVLETRYLCEGDR